MARRAALTALVTILAGLILEIAASTSITPGDAERRCDAVVAAHSCDAHARLSKSSSRRAVPLLAPQHCAVTTETRRFERQVIAPFRTRTVRHRLASLETLRI